MVAKKGDSAFGGRIRLKGLKLIADHVGVSAATVRRWTIQNQQGFPLRKIGGRFYVFQDELTDWIHQQKVNAYEQPNTDP